MTDAAGIEPSARLERRIPARSHRGALHVRRRAGADACGFDRIGLARRYLAIAGDWHDHVPWQRVFDERASGGVRR